MNNSNKRTREYWESNIEGFAGFYDQKSEETLVGPKLFTNFYRAIAFPIEKKYMRKRYEMVRTFIDSQILSGMLAADIGCGSGVFTKIIAEKGAKIFALDFSDSSLALTSRNLTEAEREKVSIIKCDIQEQEIPDVDVAIAIGVLPYVAVAERFFAHVCPHCTTLLFNYLDKNNVLNRTRSVMKILDVRGYFYQSTDEVQDWLSQYNFKIIDSQKLATGHMVTASRSDRASANK